MVKPQPDCGLPPRLGTDRQRGRAHLAPLSSRAVVCTRCRENIGVARPRRAGTINQAAAGADVDGIRPNPRRHRSRSERAGVRRVCPGGRPVARACARGRCVGRADAPLRARWQAVRLCQGATQGARHLGRQRSPGKPVPVHGTRRRALATTRRT